MPIFSPLKKFVRDTSKKTSGKTYNALIEWTQKMLSIGQYPLT